MYDPDRAEKIENLTAQWRAGMYTEAVFTASLKAKGLRREEIADLVFRNRPEFMSSLPYRRGNVW